MVLSSPRVLDKAATSCRSEEHTSELQSRPHLVCRLLLEILRRPPTSTLFPTRRSSDLYIIPIIFCRGVSGQLPPDICAYSLSSACSVYFPPPTLMALNILP